MWQVAVPLGEFYDAIVDSGRRAGYLALLTALVREADSASFYEDISRYWSSLHDVTGPDVLFVLAGPDAAAKVRDHGIPDGSEPVAYCSPSAAVIGGSKRPLRPSLSHWAPRPGTPYPPPAAQLAVPQTLAISQLRRRLGVSESRLPCFHVEFIGYVGSTKTTIVPLTSRTVYDSVKAIVSRFDEDFLAIRRHATRDSSAPHTVMAASALEAAWGRVFHIASAPTGVEPSDDKYRVFIAYESGDRWIAEHLHSALAKLTSTFLDVRCLRPGDRWVERIRKAQDNADVTVVLVGKSKATSWYQQAEYLHAIELTRANKQRLVPIYTGGSHGSPPYGLEGIQGIVTTWASGISDDDVDKAAADILGLLRGQ